MVVVVVLGERVSVVVTERWGGGVDSWGKEVVVAERGGGGGVGGAGYSHNVVESW